VKTPRETILRCRPVFKDPGRHTPVRRKTDELIERKSPRSLLNASLWNSARRKTESNPQSNGLALNGGVRAPAANGNDQDETDGEKQGRQTSPATPERHHVSIDYFFGVLSPPSSTDHGQYPLGLALKVPFFTTLIFIVVS
jgi:hypothetical protein